MPRYQSPLNDIIKNESNNNRKYIESLGSISIKKSGNQDISKFDDEEIDDWSNALVDLSKSINFKNYIDDSKFNNQTVGEKNEKLNSIITDLNTKLERLKTIKTNLETMLASSKTGSDEPIEDTMYSNEFNNVSDSSDEMVNVDDISINNDQAEDVINFLAEVPNTDNANNEDSMNEYNQNENLRGDEELVKNEAEKTQPAFKNDFKSSSEEIIHNDQASGVLNSSEEIHDTNNANNQDLNSLAEHNINEKFRKYGTMIKAELKKIKQSFKKDSEKPVKEVADNDQANEAFDSSEEVLDTDNTNNQDLNSLAEHDINEKFKKYGEMIKAELEKIKPPYENGSEKPIEEVTPDNTFDCHNCENEYDTIIGSVYTFDNQPGQLHIHIVISFSE